MAATVRPISLVLLFLVAPLVQAQDESAGADVPAAAETQLPEESPQPETVVEETGPVDDTVAESAEVSRDVVLVLDNSGSMRRNDPQSLAPAAVEKFIQELDPASRVALLIFDEDVTLAQDFINVESGRDQLLGSMDAIDYSGQYTDSPAAIERAVYALKNDARDDARRIIIFMTDGIVDTGNPQTDVSRADWLRDDLASDAARAGIQIFGIAFTNAADFQLIQSLANKTGGDYFRALAADDLSGVFERINAAIIREAEPEPEPEPAPAAPQPQQQVIQAPAPEPIIIEVPSKSEELSREERTRNLILIVAAGILCLTVLAILIVLIKRGRAGREPEAEYEPKAYLSDIHGVTEKQSYQLGRKPTMLGRVAGTDSDHLDYVVIPETTVGRRHALIEYKDYAYWIIDQGSINGTYVNDHMVNTETRLKHGDRIRLHKFEFEFVMPEMFDSGMTVVSNTVYARDIASDEEASQSVVADGGEDDSGNFDRLFDIDSGDDSSPSSGRITLSEDNYGDGEDATIQYGDDREAGASQPVEPTLDPGEEDDDVTLTPGMDPVADDEDATLRHISSGSDNDGDDSDEWETDNGHRDKDR